MKKLFFLFTLTGFIACSETKTSQKPDYTFEKEQMEFYKMDWTRSKKHTLALVDSMPEVKLDFKSNEEARSFSEDIKHIVGANYNMISTALSIEAPKIDMKAIQTKAELLSTVDDGYNWVLKSLDEYDVSKNKDTIELFGRVKMPRVRAITKAYEHQAHHKSKAIASQRMAGQTPPEFVAYFFD